MVAQFERFLPWVSASFSLWVYSKNFLTIACELSILRHFGTSRASAELMTTFDMIVSVAFVVPGGAAMGYATYLDQISGQDRPCDPEHLHLFVEKQIPLAQGRDEKLRR